MNAIAHLLEQYSMQWQQAPTGQTGASDAEVVSVRRPPHGPAPKSGSAEVEEP